MENKISFNEILGIKEYDSSHYSLNFRNAVRAVILRDNKLLMIQTNKGDYKFPGGGIEVNESHEDALKREIEEETGCLLSKMSEMIGIVVEREYDKVDEQCIFQMTSYYYICEVSDRKTCQKLDEYEERLEFCPLWVEINDLIVKNENIMELEDKNCWVARETYVLKRLKELFGAAE